MALPDSAKYVRGTTLVFSDSVYVPTVVAGAPTGSDADFDLLNLATGGVAHESAKMDLTANFDVEYIVQPYIEWHAPASAPTAGGTVDFYAGYSDSPTAATNNPAGLAGVTGVYQGYGSTTADGTEGLKQLEFIGSLVATADLTVQTGVIGTIRPSDRYMMLVAVNNTDAIVCDTDSIETCVALVPMTLQLQD